MPPELGESRQRARLIAPAVFTASLVRTSHTARMATPRAPTPPACTQLLDNETSGFRVQLRSGEGKKADVARWYRLYGRLESKQGHNALAKVRPFAACTFSLVGRAEGAWRFPALASPWSCTPA